MTILLYRNIQSKCYWFQCYSFHYYWKIFIYKQSYVTYIISIHNLDFTYEQLSNELISNVNDGTFTKILTTEAVKLSLSVLQNVTSTTIVTIDLNPLTDDDNSNKKKKKKLKTGAIVAIAVTKMIIELIDIQEEENIYKKQKK